MTHYLLYMVLLMLRHLLYTVIDPPLFRMFGQRTVRIALLLHLCSLRHPTPYTVAEAVLYCDTNMILRHFSINRKHLVLKKTRYLVKCFVHWLYRIVPEAKYRYISSQECRNAATTSNLSSNN